MSLAADEVGLTQSAVSRQVAQLEAMLGTSLFDRLGRRIALNAAGRRYAAEIGPALTRIGRASLDAISGSTSRTLELATLPGFGMRWLAPRLAGLSTRHPDLVVNVTARSDVFDFANERFDAAIHVGDAGWPQARHDLLFREVVVPVASPEFVASHRIREAKDLASVPLMLQSRRASAWQRWFELSGTPFHPERRLPQFSEFLMLAQAVAAGAGAALLPTFLIEQELLCGTLVVPVDLPMDDERAYWLVAPHHREEEVALTQFRSWITSEAAAHSAPGGLT